MQVDATTHVIRNRADLITLRTKRGLGIIILGVDHPRREQWEGDLNEHYHACGCDTGERAMLAGLALSVLLIIVIWVSRWIAASVLAIVLTLALGGIGKVYGIVRARRKLARTIREIEAVWGD